MEKNQFLPSEKKWMDLGGNKSDRERQIPYASSYMWNLKNKINKQNITRLIDVENKFMVAGGEG